MNTAREKLLESLILIVKEPFSDKAQIQVARILKSFRVQLKPEETIRQGKTARDELLDRLVYAWQKENSLSKRTVLDIFFSFRMQVKQGLKKAKEKLQNGDFDENVQFIKPTQKAKKTSENAFFNKKNTQTKIDQIAGGPKKKQTQRGACPKCRSIGLVLSPSLNEEEHLACIYCGYKSFLNTVNAELDLKVAAFILEGDE